MNYTKKDLDKAQVELTITVTSKEYAPDLENAAMFISQKTEIKGFRPGKAPYEKVKQQVGEIKIMEQAMQHIVEKNYTTAIKESGIETVGMPQITIEKMAPGNDFVFKAIVALMPSIKLGELSKINVQKKKIEIDDKKVDEVLTSLTKMQAKEVIKKGKATKNDKVTISMEMFLNKIPVEGGQAQNHGVYLNEPHYVKGLDEQLIGLEKNQEKEFILKFPKEHYQKHLADKNIEFKVKVTDVFEIQYPEIDDEFAKSLGIDGLDKLKSTLRTNLATEEEKKDEQRIEIEIFDTLIKNSEFGDIPQILIDHEKQKMFQELKSHITQQGIDMDKYLKDLKKTEEEISKDFAEGALKRVKASLISRQIASDNKLQPSKDEVDKEIEMIKMTYKDDPNIEENLKRIDVIETLAVAVQNRKVVKWLKEQVLKTTKKEDTK